MSTELYRKHRPKTFKAVLGQKSVTAQLKELVTNNDVPHSTLFHGPSGCGKTTLGRILASKLGCVGSDLQELNAASCRGVEDIRTIERRMHSAPLEGTCRVWILDEAHKLTNDAQNALLKMLEDPPDHVYFIICTTLPHKLIKTIWNRCTRFQLRLVPDKQLIELLSSVAEKESIKLPPKIAKAIAENALGSPRAALVMLQAIRRLSSEEEQLEAINATTQEQIAFDLIKMLLYERAGWGKVAKFLQTFEEDAEGFRRFVLAVATTELLKNNPKTTGRAYTIINAFRDNYFDSDRAGLAASCYEVVSGK